MLIFVFAKMQQEMQQRKDKSNIQKDTKYNFWLCSIKTYTNVLHNLTICPELCKKK